MEEEQQPNNEYDAPSETISFNDRIKALKQNIIDKYTYCTTGVWRDSRTTWKVETVKIINLSVRSFLDRDLQSQACAMAFRTILALVPALALLLAIGRGFGFQELLKEQLYSYFPSQREILGEAFNFVDSYLNQASEGIFVGVGILFLLWTLISLLMSAEDTFNTIWNVHGRTLIRKMTDYIAILLVLPILMICSAGLTLLMSNTLQHIIHVDSLRPAIDWLLDLGSLVFTALFFSGAYMLIPNTKVKYKNAFIIGLIVAVAFQLLQWLFVTGQLYVTRYNAIYGSFSFLPLFLIWLQLVWLITLIGALLCYALQNVGFYNFFIDSKDISTAYYRKVVLGVMTVISKRFYADMPALTAGELSKQYSFPMSLVNTIIPILHSAGLISFLKPTGDTDDCPIQPALDVSTLTCGEVLKKVQNVGSANFIPEFDENFKEPNELCDEITTEMVDMADNVKIISFNIQL